MTFNAVRSVIMLSLFGLSATAWGWGDIGHETVAHIAQKYLTPEARKVVEDNLGPELLAIAATWPDSVRDDVERYKPFAEYHFCDDAAGVTVENLSKNKEHNCFAVFSQGPALLKDPKISDNAKMIIMRFIIHVAGDVHQPLHIGNGLDAGGNACKISVEKIIDGRHLQVEENLHSYWDTALVVALSGKIRAQSHSPGFFGSKQLADAIIKDKSAKTSPAQLEALMNSQPVDWIRESADLRRAKSYPDALLKLNITNDRDRTYCTYREPGEFTDHKEHFDGSHLPVLSGKFPSDEAKALAEKYDAESQEIIADQLWKGGVRLAGFLNRITKDIPPPAAPDPTIQEVLGGMSNPQAKKTH